MAVDEASEDWGWEVGGNFSDDLFEETVLRRRSTRREWYDERTQGLLRAKELPRASLNTPTNSLPATTQELRQLQESDESLAKVDKVPSYFQRDGVMYRRWVPQGRGEENAVEQVILPMQDVQERFTGALSHHSPWWPPGKEEDCREDTAKILLADVVS